MIVGPVFLSVELFAQVIRLAMCFASAIVCCSFVLCRYPDSIAPEIAQLLPSMHGTFDGLIQPIVQHNDKSNEMKKERKKKQIMQI